MEDGLGREKRGKEGTLGEEERGEGLLDLCLSAC
jgi:hypothetical protein